MKTTEKTLAILKTGITIDEIVHALTKKYGKVDVERSIYYELFLLHFTDGDDKRSMNVYFGKPEGVQCSLVFWGNSVGIMQYLCDTLGGHLIEKGYDEIKYEALCFTYPVDPESIAGTGRTSLDQLKREISENLGHNKLQIALDLFEKYKNIA